MDTIVSLLSDLIIIVFDIALYMKLTLLKKENTLYRSLMYGGSLFIIILYSIATAVWHVPYAAASFVCMTVPSFLLFLSLSKYKSARFLVTFCFVDTVTFIIGFIGKVAFIFGGAMGGIVGSTVELVLCIVSYFLLLPYCAKYRKLMDQVATGWVPMAISTIFIYILLVFAAAYPTPFMTRLEYLPVYLVLCVTILSFYAVFIVLIMQKAKLTHANALLKQQQHWHDLAYLDELTQLSNQAAYVARTSELEKEESHEKEWSVLVFDIDNFKNVNDTYGHLYGNQVLQNAAHFFKTTFPGENYEFFRVGGDEFAALANSLPKEDIEVQVQKINAMGPNKDPGCTFSCGCGFVDFSQQNAFQLAFSKADEAMYSAKRKKKQK